MAAADNGHLALLLTPRAGDGQGALGGQLEDQGFRVIVPPTGRRWLAVLGRSQSADLLVTVLGGPSSSARLRAAALIARHHAIPLIAVETTDGAAAAAQRSRLTRVFTARVISRVVPCSASPMLTPGMLVELGIGEPGATDGIGPLTLADLGAVVRIHQAAFPDSAMTHLGPRVVERYYRWQFIGDHPAPFATGFRRDGVLVGYLFGGLRRDAVSGYARRFLPTIVWGALTHPGGVRRLAGPKVGQVVRLMFRRRPAVSVGQSVSGWVVANAAGSAKPSFGVLSIAVAPAAQGSGAATALVAAAEARARDLGLDQLHLTVDPGNARAVRFYEREGWERVADSGASWAGRMRRSLEPDADPPANGVSVAGQVAGADRMI